jgi:hypothetical protein
MFVAAEPFRARRADGAIAQSRTFGRATHDADVLCRKQPFNVLPSIAPSAIVFSNATVKPCRRLSVLCRNVTEKTPQFLAAFPIRPWHIIHTGLYIEYI